MVNSHSSEGMMVMVNIWGVNAQKHWQSNRPKSYAALEDPQEFFTMLGQEAAARYLVLRDTLLEGVNPNDGTVSWAEFGDRSAQADQTAQEIVEREMIYLPPDEKGLTEP